MPEPKVLRAKGLYLDENQLSQVPEGALTRADNIVIQNDGVIRPRRGMRTWVSTGSTPTQFAEFLGEAIQFDPTDIYHLVKSGTAPGSDIATPTHLCSWSSLGTIRTKAVQFLKSLFFTAGGGIQWLQSPTGVASSPGVPQCGDCTDFTLPDSTGGFIWLPNNSSVAYRACLIKRSDNGFLMFGPPGGLLSIINTTGNKVDVRVSVSIPAGLGIDTSYILQLYRTRWVSGTSALDIPTPGEEMFLVYESGITAAQLAAGTVSILDIADNPALGAIAYFSPSQGGIIQSNRRPPKALDVESFRQRLFAANTERSGRIILRILGTTRSLPDFSYSTIRIVTSAGRFYLSGGDGTHVNSGQQFIAPSGGSPASNIATAAKNMCACINRQGWGITATYLENGDDFSTVGQILIQANDTSQNSVLSIGGAGSIETMNFTYSYDGVSGVNTVTTPTPHGLAPGNYILLHSSPYADVNATVDTVTSPTTFTTIGAATLFPPSTGSGTYIVPAGKSDITFSPSLDDDNSPVAFDAERKVNRVYYSKANEPYAFTDTGYFDVGGEEYEVSRIKRLGSSLFIFKEKGLYRLIGTDPSNWRVDPFDESVNLISPESIAVVDGKIYCLTDMGVIELTESGKRVISRPIESLIMPITNQQGFAGQYDTFAVGRQSDHLYTLFITNVDGTSFLGLTYSIYEQAWTSRTDRAKCGLEFSDGRMILGSRDDYSPFVAAQKAPTIYVAIERRFEGGIFGDFADDSLSTFITSAASTGDTSLVLSSVAGVAVGDTLYAILGATPFYAKVIGKNGSTVALDTPIPQAMGVNAPVSLAHHIGCAFEYSVSTAGEPGRMKHYQECEFLLRDTGFRKLYVGFASDYAPAIVRAAVNGGLVGGDSANPGAVAVAGDGFFTAKNDLLGLTPGNILGATDRTKSPRTARTYVDFAHRRATRLYVCADIPVAGETFSLEGVSLRTAESSSTRTVR